MVTTEKKRMEKVSSFWSHKFLWLFCVKVWIFDLWFHKSNIWYTYVWWYSISVCWCFDNLNWFFFVLPLIYCYHLHYLLYLSIKSYVTNNHLWIWWLWYKYDKKHSLDHILQSFTMKLFLVLPAILLMQKTRFSSIIKDKQLLELDSTLSQSRIELWNWIFNF